MLSYHADFVMADPVQLRKCEELLGKLPEEAPARLRNPVWTFLRGIEGFDNLRASECLVKLLDKHYDTIAVLKLATKRDLVEDAGILPGDALRIVAAAKSYVTLRDADPNPEPTPQIDAPKPGDGAAASTEGHDMQGVDHLQHAYKPPALREKTVIFTPPVTSQASTHQYSPPEKKAKNVAQESGKSEEQVAVNRGASGREIGIYVKDVTPGIVPKQELVKESRIVNLAAPKHVKDVLPANDVKVPAQIYPIPVGITYPHICGICNIKCVSEVNCRMHYNGRMHREKFAAVLEAVKEAKQPTVAVKETKQAAQTQGVVLEAKKPTQSTPFFPVHACGVCNVKCNSEVDIRSHFNGRKHAQNMALAAESNDNSPVPFLYCSICNINSACKRNLVMHFNGKKHAQNMEVDSDSGDSSYYSNSESEC